VLEHGPFVALGLLIIWAILLIPLTRGTLKAIPFGAASMFLALMIPFFWLGPEITELTILKVGSFKTNAEQANKYFDEIKTIRSKIEGQERAINNAVELFNKKIADQTATVDQVAKKASAAEQLSKEAEEQINEARKSLADVNSTISEARASLEKVQAIVSFTELITDAQNDDRNAFDELRKIANDPHNPLAQKADTAWRSLSISFASALQLECILRLVSELRPPPAVASTWRAQLFCVRSKTKREVRLIDNETRISGARRTDVTGWVPSC
jgi:chromosome segregation ATPase